MNVETVDNVGIQKLKQFHMVNIKTKFPRGISGQTISQANSTRGLSGVRSGPGLKQQASSFRRQAIKHQAASVKPQAASFKRQATSVPTRITSVKLQAASSKRQASSPRQQASSVKPQAASSEILEPRYKKTEEVFLGKGPRAFTMINVFFG